MASSYETTRTVFDRKTCTVVIAATALLLASTPLQAQRNDTLVVSLDEMIQTALSQNLQLRQAIAATDAAQTSSGAIRSRFDPVLNVGGDSDTEGVGGQIAGLLPTGGSYLLGSIAPTALPGEPLYASALVASMSQPLLRGFGWWSARAAVRATDEGVEAARSRLSRARAEVTANVRIAYAMLVERHRQEAIAQGSVRRAEDLRDAYTKLRELEKITKVDLITAQLGAASRMASLLEVRRERRDAEDALVFAVYGANAPAVFARGVTVLVPRDSLATVPPLAPMDSAIARAIRTRDDVAAAQHEAERARYLAQYARNATLPTLNIYGAVSRTTTRSTIGGLGPTEGGIQDQSFGIVFSRPLWNGSASAERKRAEAAESQARIAIAEAENVVRAEVRAAYREIELGQQQVALASEASRLAREQYEGGRERLTLGLTDIFRVLQYDEQVARAESAEASAVLALAVAVAWYWLAVGE